MLLYDFQGAAIDLVRDCFRGGGRRALLVSPAGSGKTIIFCWLAAEAVRRGKRVLMVGRALRPAPGKERSVVLDHAGVSLRFGLYDFAREWSLDGRPRRPGEAPVKRCPECGAMVPLAATECPECGASFERRRREIEEDDGALEEIDGITLDLRRMSYHRALAWAGYDPGRLRLVAVARGYKPGWVYHRMREQSIAP
jgi:superfamily II DNA or RNA helicase